MRPQAVTHSDRSRITSNGRQFLEPALRTFHCIKRQIYKTNLQACFSKWI